MTIWKHGDVGHSQGATQALAKMFDGKKYFDYPKPVDLIILLSRLPHPRLLLRLSHNRPRCYAVECRRWR